MLRTELDDHLRAEHPADLDDDTAEFDRPVTPTPPTDDGTAEPPDAEPNTGDTAGGGTPRPSDDESREAASSTSSASESAADDTP